VKSSLEKRKKADQERLVKKAGSLRLYTRNMWHKGDDEDKLKEWRDKIKSATKYFHVRAVCYLLTGIDYLKVAADVHNLRTLQDVVSEIKDTHQKQTAHLEAIRRTQEEARVAQEKVLRAQEEARLVQLKFQEEARLAHEEVIRLQEDIRRKQEEAQQAQEEARRADEEARRRQEEEKDWGELLF
jgi:hypothetical protein